MDAKREDMLALRVAKQVVVRAWEKIAQFYGGSFEIHDKEDGPATTADRVADRAIVSELQSIFPPQEYGYLSEETEDDFDRLAHNRAWIIDPIDGTNDFIEQTGQFCIQVGLVRRVKVNWQPVAAIVYQPAENRLYSALAGGGATVEENGRTRTLRVSSHRILGNMRAVISRSHVDESLMSLVRNLAPAGFVHVGSVGLKACAVATGDADYYVNIAPDKTKEWDSCAPHLILEEAGGRMTDLRGFALKYNQRDVRHHFALLASNGHAHSMLAEAVRRHFANPEAPASPLLLERLGIKRLPRDGKG